MWSEEVLKISSNLGLKYMQTYKHSQRNCHIWDQDKTTTSTTSVVSCHQGLPCSYESQHSPGLPLSGHPKSHNVYYKEDTTLTP